MSEMVERVAKAIYEADWPTAPSTKWEDAVPSQRALCRIKARAAIAALREPSNQMIEAAWALFEKKDGHRVSVTGGNGDLADPGWETHYFQAMIDAALSEE